MFELSIDNSDEEVSQIVSDVSGIDKYIIEEFTSIVLKYYDTLIETNDNFKCCYFHLNSEYCRNKYSSVGASYKIKSYCLDKLIGTNTYRISFDSYGIFLFKLFCSFVSGGISKAAFMSLQSFVEYLITSNTKLSDVESCILYTILLDLKCRNAYFDAGCLYKKYYEKLNKRHDTCLFNLSEVRCFYNEYDNRCKISKNDFDKVLCELVNKKALESSETGKYKVK